MNVTILLQNEQDKRILIFDVEYCPEKGCECEKSTIFNQYDIDNDLYIR